MNLSKLLVFAAVAGASYAVQAQNLVIENFEDGTVSFTDAVNVIPDNGCTFEVVPNPSKDAVNTSGKCWKFERGSATNNWTGFWCSLKTPVSLDSYRYLHIKYRRTNGASRLRVNFEGDGFSKTEFLPMETHAPQQTGQWESLVYDLSDNGLTGSGKVLKVLGLQPDFQPSEPVTGTNTAYIDDIVLSNSESADDSFASYIPKGLMASDVTTSSLSLQWEPLDKAVSYDVYKDDVFVGNTSATQYAFDNLDEHGLYKLHVVAVNASGQKSMGAEPIYVQTNETQAHKDARMAWWREARFGMFIHWGGYAAFAGHYEGKNVVGEDIVYDANGNENGSYAEWIMFGARIPRDIYKAKVKTDLTAANYNPKDWVRMAKDAGMKYIIVTAKHHEGLAMFDTRAGWNVVDHSAAGRDLMRDLVDEAHKAGLKIGFYYSQALDWNNEGGLGWMPQNNNGDGGEWPIDKKTAYVKNLVIPHLNTILDNYDIDVMWFDMGEAKHPELQYLTLKAIKDNPNSANLIFNDRLAFNVDQGWSGDHSTPEQSIPDVPVTGRADGRDWETCMTLNNNWGYCAQDNNWKSTTDVVHKLIDIASKGGNYLLNIGPKADGTFPQESIDRLGEIGDWMDVNSEAVYGTVANPFSKPLAWGRATRKVDADGNVTLYIHVFDLPESGILELPQLATVPASVSVLGSDAAVAASKSGSYVTLSGVPTQHVNPISTTVKMQFEGAPVILDNTVQPAADGTILLLPEDSKVDGSICIEGDEGNKNFGCWASTSAGPVEGNSITWKFRSISDCAHYVDVKMGAVGAGTLDFDIDGDKTSLEYPGETEYGTHRLGEVTFSRGVHTLKLTRSALANDWNYLNLLSVKFTPKDPTAIIVPSVADTFTVTVSGSTIALDGLPHQGRISIYNPMGLRLMTHVASSESASIDINYSGIFFVVVENKDHALVSVKKLYM